MTRNFFGKEKRLKNTCSAGISALWIEEISLILQSETSREISSELLSDRNFKHMLFLGGVCVIPLLPIYSNVLQRVLVASWWETQRAAATEASKQSGTEILQIIPDLKSFGIHLNGFMTRNVSKHGQIKSNYSRKSRHLSLSVPVTYFQSSNTCEGLRKRRREKQLSHYLEFRLQYPF